MKDRRRSFSDIGLLFAFCVLALPACAADAPAPTAEQVAFFEKQVKPLLETTCFKCHGAEAKIKAGLRLTSRQGVIKGGTQGSAIDFKNPEQSVLLHMLTYKDDDHSMPPKGKLPQEKIDILTQWVKMGVPWTPGAVEPQPAPVAELSQENRKDWWCYHKLTRPAVPEVKNKPWVSNPIDAFLLAKLEPKGLTPVAPAEKIALMRRAYYDLIGLPPTPAEVDAYVADKSPDAYEKLIDKLLESPHYGEKWGRHWLDLVRYAETNGYERDGPKPYVWRYRDYVIRSFNQDKPYDRFLKEQIAGDELDEVTADSLIATGYYRLGIWDDEPADRAQARYDVLDGIVSTTSQVVLGMTVNCARCHDHKRDPILQRDYYSMLAFFQDVTELRPGDNLREVALPEDKSEFEKRLAVKQSTEERLTREVAEVEKEFRDKLGKAEPELAKQLSADGVKRAAAAPDILPDSRKEGQVWSYTFTRPATFDWMLLNYEAKGWNEGPGGFGTKGTPGSVVRTTWSTDDIWMRKKFTAKAPLPATFSVSIHHDEDAEIYLNGIQIATVSGFIAKYTTVPVSPDGIKALKEGENIIAVHCHQTIGGQYIDAGLVCHSEGTTIADLLHSQGVKLIGKERVDRFFNLSDELAKSRARKIETGALALVVRENGHMPTHILARGNPNLPGEEVTPAFPVVLEAPPVVLPKNPTGLDGKRRILAEWLASKDNRLTARVMANRLWQFHFGRGIVRTANDFGRLGELPTHPELLDWLASELMARDWKLKTMHKLIMTSSAYRMSCNEDVAGLEKDPSNDLFWRFDMRRMSAEEIRDSVLVVDGAMNLKMGGPSVYPELPPEVLATSSNPAAAWGKSPKEEQDRRSVYVYIKRSLVEPILNTFDLADTDTSCPVRFATTVPTQSLTSLNSKFFNDQADALARRLKKEAGDKAEEQVRLALRLTLLHEPRAADVQRCVTFMTRLQTEDKLSKDQALNAFCLMALNLNEFIYLE